MNMYKKEGCVMTVAQIKVVILSTEALHFFPLPFDWCQSSSIDATAVSIKVISLKSTQ